MKGKITPALLLRRDNSCYPLLLLNCCCFSVETSRTKLNNEDEEECPQPVRKVIKPDFTLFLDSFDVSTFYCTSEFLNRSQNLQKWGKSVCLYYLHISLLSIKKFLIAFNIIVKIIG